MSNEDRAVSPVIGVILMVAITVILAAVIAAFVMGIGPGDSAVTAAVEVDGDGSTEVELSVTQGGDADYIVLVDSNGDVVGQGEQSNSGAIYTAANTSVSGISSTDFSLGADELDQGSNYRVYAVKSSSATIATVDEADAATQVASFTYDS